MPGTLKKNLWLGLVAGVAGTAAMDAYWAAVYKAKPDLLSGGPSEEPPTEKLARRALRQAGVKKPSSQTRALGGKTIHWGYGTSWGVAAGIARTAGVRLDWGAGAALGAGLWALGDLWMLYKLDLAKHPREYPARIHATALGAHLAYGLGVWAAVETLSKFEKKPQRSWRFAA